MRRWVLGCRAPEAGHHAVLLPLVPQVPCRHHAPKPCSLNLALHPALPVQAGDKLVVLEVQSDVLCQTGFEEEAELQWKADQKAALAPCSDLKHTFARTARECGDVVFLSLEVSRMCERVEWS